MFVSKVEIRRQIEGRGHQLGAFANDETGLPMAACDHCNGAVILYGDGSYVMDDVLYEDCRQRPVVRWNHE